jgi:hypothetical protein
MAIIKVCDKSAISGSNIPKRSKGLAEISIEYGSDSPPLCGEKRNLQSEPLGLAADLLPYPVCLQRGS